MDDLGNIALLLHELCSGSRKLKSALDLRPPFRTLVLSLHEGLILAAELVKKAGERLLVLDEVLQRSPQHVRLWGIAAATFLVCSLLCDDAVLHDVPQMCSVCYEDARLVHERTSHQALLLCVFPHMRVDGAGWIV